MIELNYQKYLLNLMFYLFRETQVRIELILVFQGTLI